MKKSRQHEGALLWASRGVPVFPVWADDLSMDPKKLKSPLPGSHGFYDATTDVATINAWWEKNPKFNVATSPAATGHLVIDIDRPEAYAELEVEFGQLPATYTVQTPSGNRHLWYKGTAPASAGRLANKVDVRSEGSYVLLPPSVIHGNPYKVIEGTWTEIPPCPDQYRAAMKVKADTSKDQAAPEGIEIDEPSAIERGRAISLLWPGAVYGTIDDTTYLHCAELADLALSPEIICGIIEDWYGRTGTDGNLERLGTVASSACRNRQNAYGVWAVKPPEEVFANYAGTIFEAPDDDAFSVYKPLTEDEADLLPDPTWLIPDVLPQRSIAVLYAPSKAWKTFVALDWSLTIASGIAKWGEVEQGDVVYVAAEGPSGMSKKRKPSWKMLHGVDGPLPFYVVQKMPWFTKPDEIMGMVKWIRKMKLKPKLVVLDTLARAMVNLDENSAKEAGFAIETIEALKRELDCTILVLHHTGKSKGSGLRGSSALMAGFDTGLELETDKETMTTAIWARWHKDAETRDAPWAMKAEKIGPSFALRFQTPEDVPQDERLRASDVGGVLERMGAQCEVDAVTHHAIIESLVQMKGWDKKNASRAFRSLLASGALAGYEVEGRFFIPAPSTTEPLPL